MDIPDTHKTFSSVSILSPSSEPEPSLWGGGTMRQCNGSSVALLWSAENGKTLVSVVSHSACCVGRNVAVTILGEQTWKRCSLMLYNTNLNNLNKFFRGGHHLSIMISDWEHLYLLFYKPSNLQHYQILSNIAWMSGGGRQDTDRRNHWDREHGQ